MNTVAKTDGSTVTFTKLPDGKLKAMGGTWDQEAHFGADQGVRSAPAAERQGRHLGGQGTLFSGAPRNIVPYFGEHFSSSRRSDICYAVTRSNKEREH